MSVLNLLDNALGSLSESAVLCTRFTWVECSAMHSVQIERANDNSLGFDKPNESWTDYVLCILFLLDFE